ncbi:hypothetical protein CL632_03515 [bacterium]|jgi:hypothetical protein|nr:hypothetical protein [bacterium]MDP6571718.1 hypothetical protein [Patescibacteria group bacterium]MDP6756296.1 hypothetical protein [Patescibacteria group bacterium]|tara:strand:- start:3928 stop:4548 length:621 start_codon:yes stop_codon:yes gene_type:complete
MYYSTKRGYLNIILLIIILLALLVLVAWLAYQAGSNAAEGRIANFEQANVIVDGSDIALTTISLAQNANLQKTSAAAQISSEQGKVEIDVRLDEVAVLPENSVLAGWLVDAGKLGGLGETSESDLDQQYGTPFANIDFSSRVGEAPYALSLGGLAWNSERKSYYLFFNGIDPIIPYDAIMITLESDGNQANFDPRPGTPILIGAIQ